MFSSSSILALVAPAIVAAFLLLYKPAGKLSTIASVITVIAMGVSFGIGDRVTPPDDSNINWQSVKEIQRVKNEQRSSKV